MKILKTGTHVKKRYLKDFTRSSNLPISAQYWDLTIVLDSDKCFVYIW